MKKKRWQGILLIIGVLLIAAMLAAMAGLAQRIEAKLEQADWLAWGKSSDPLERLMQAEIPEWIDVQLIGVDGESRRGEKLEGVEDIVIHYVGNPGTTAQQNRNWYDNPESSVSSHFVVGLEGEIIQCIPLDEKSSATNWRNADTISIEVCHPDKTGEFTDAAYESVVKLTAWLLENSGLDESHIIRHYDVTGKECPLYFVEHEDAWQQFKEDAASYAD